MLTIGQKISFIKDTENPPLKSPHTDMVLAWITCGGSCLKGNEYLDTVQTFADGTQRRSVTWYIDDNKPVHFNLTGGVCDTVDFTEFKRRWMDENWMRTNRDHPMAFLKMYRENETKIRDWIKRQKPAVLIEKNGKTAIIPADCPEAQKNKILAELRR